MLQSVSLSVLEAAAAKAEQFVLSRPLGWQVGEASDAHPVRESAFDGRFDEIGCKEGKRDRHVYFADATIRALRDAFRGY